jgi:hypothetical protein
MSNNMGSMFVYYVVTIIACILIVIGFLLRRLHPYIAKKHTDLRNYFLWNFIIRLIFEATMELSFCVILAMKFTSIY